jgi:uncharacterized protein YgiM (DUF1202 family)
MIRNRPLLTAVLLAFLALRSVSAEPAVIRADRVNVRVQPARDAEVISTLRRGDTVDVRGPAGDGWVRIAWPAKAPVWVYGPLLDVSARRVRAKEANLRTGPGKNYSPIGTLRQGDSTSVVREGHGAGTVVVEERLHQGDAVKVIRESDGWVQIEPPAGLSSYISSGFVKAGSDSAVVLEPVRTGGILPPETVVTRQAVEAVQPAPAAPPKARTVVTRTTLSPPETVIRAESPNSNASVTGQSVAGSTTVVTSDTRVQAESPNSKSTVTGQSVVAAAKSTTGSSVAVERQTSAVVLPPAVPQSSPVTYRSTIVEGSQTLLRYSETVRTVVRVGRVALSLDPVSPSYFELNSVLPGEGTLGYLTSTDASIKFGGYRGKVVRVTADEYQTQAPPARTVLQVRTLELEPGY